MGRRQPDLDEALHDLDGAAAGGGSAGLFLGALPATSWTLCKPSIRASSVEGHTLARVRSKCVQVPGPVRPPAGLRKSGRSISAPPARQMGV